MILCEWVWLHDLTSNYWLIRNRTLISNFKSAKFRNANAKTPYIEHINYLSRMNHVYEMKNLENAQKDYLLINFSISWQYNFLSIFMLLFIRSDAIKIEYTKSFIYQSKTLYDIEFRLILIWKKKSERKHTLHIERKSVQRIEVNWHSKDMKKTSLPKNLSTIFMRARSENS